MARQSPQTPSWAIQMLKEFSPGELQSGAIINKPSKSRDGTISLQPSRNKGTRIPASTWSRMQSGEIKPGEKTLKKLASFKQRYQYNLLRATGTPMKEAKKLSRLADIHEVKNEAKIYIQQAKNVAHALSVTQNRFIAFEWVMYNMMKGERDIEDWDKYVTALIG